MNENYYHRKEVKLFITFGIISLISFCFRILLRYYNYDLYFLYFVPSIPNFGMLIGSIFTIFQILLVVLTLYYLFRLRSMNFINLSVFCLNFFKSLFSGIIVLILGKTTLFYFYGFFFKTEIQLNAIQNTLNEIFISLLIIYLTFHLVKACLNVEIVINNIIRKGNFYLKSYFICFVFIILNLKYALFYLLNFTNEFYILLYGLALTVVYYGVYLIMFVAMINLLQRNSEENYSA